MGPCSAIAVVLVLAALASAQNAPQFQYFQTLKEDNQTYCSYGTSSIVIGVTTYIVSTACDLSGPLLHHWDGLLMLLL